MAEKEEQVSAVHARATEVLATLAPPEPDVFALAFAEVFGSPPEFSGRYCPLCGDTTPHCRVRGKFRKEVKQLPWFCAPCLQPGGALNKIVRSLMIRQGETAP